METLKINFEKKIPLIFEKNHTTYHFVVVGAGGTGGHLVPNLARLISIKNNESKQHTLTIIDNDIVEEKNLIRQNFTNNDINKNKAEVLATRYSRAYGLPINYVPSYLESPYDLFKILQNTIDGYVLHLSSSLNDNGYDAKTKKENEITYYTRLRNRYIHNYFENEGRSNDIVVLIDCTDNNKTRLILHNFMELYSKFLPIVFLSSGNGEDSGQVILGYRCQDGNFNNSSFSEDDWSKLNSLKVAPSFFDIFPNIEIDKLPSELSCAEFAVSAPQNIGANINAANILFDYLNKLLNFIPINELAVFFDIKSMNRSTFYSNKTDMKRLLSMSENNYLYYFFTNTTAEERESISKPVLWEELLRENLNKTVEVNIQKEITLF